MRDTERYYRMTLLREQISELLDSLDHHPDDTTITDRIDKLRRELSDLENYDYETGRS